MKRFYSLYRVAGALFLLLSVLCMAVACGDDRPMPAESVSDTVGETADRVTESETVSETTPAAESEIIPETEPETEPVNPVIASGEGGEFVIVCAADAGEAVRAQADRLSAELSRLYGQAPSVVTDGEATAAYEIRVGRTGRGESILPADRPYALGMEVETEGERVALTLEAAREDFLVRVIDRLLQAVPAVEGVLRLSDVEPFVDDGAAYTDGIAVAVMGVTDFTVVLPTLPTDATDADREAVLTLEWLAHRLQQAGIDVELVQKNLPERRSITVVVDAEMKDDWRLLRDRVGNLTVKGRTPHMASLGLVELAGRMAPTAYGDIVLPITDTIVGDSTVYTRDNWSLAVPACRTGILATSDYEIGSGLENDNKVNTWSNGRMAVVREVTEADYRTYAELLLENGYTMIEEKAVEAMRGTSVYGQYRRGLSLVFVSFNYTDKALRIIEDRASVAESAFEYSFEHTADTPTDVILYGLKMHPQGINADEPGGDPTIQNCGALLMIAQADGSLFVIDGGSKLQATDAALEGLWAYMHEITGTPDGEPIRIACWFITHPHGDHYTMIDALIKRHHEEIQLERVLFNFQNARFTGHGVQDAIRRGIREHYPDILYLKCHTGQSLTLGSLTLDVMATHEDAVNLRSGKSNVGDSNSMTTVLRVTLADGSRIMLLGDVTEERDRGIATAFTQEEFKSDMVQISHHAWNSLPLLYRWIHAEYTLWPQYEPSNFTGAHYDWAMNVTKQVTENGAEHFYYAGINTVRLTWRNGEATVELTDVIC